MTLSASQRGWGKGWPKDRSGEMLWVKAFRSGAKWQVHREVAPILHKIVNDAEARGFLFDHGPADTNDDWGYANRPIGGTRTPSNHSWGLAVDINAQDYPQGQRRRVPPQWLISLFAEYGWAWGGTWSHADPMHFEYTGTPHDARRTVARIAGTPPAPTPTKLPVRQALVIGARGRLVEIAQWELAVISGAQFPGEVGIYWGFLEHALVNLGKVLGKSWDGHTLGAEQWSAIDFIYLSKGHAPVTS